MVFADEPAGNLDQHAGGELLELLAWMVHEASQTIVMVTHDPGAAGHTDRAVFLVDGHLVGDIDRPTTAAVVRPDQGAGELKALLSVVLRGARERRLRLALTVSAIVVGVAFLSGTLVLTATVRQAIRQQNATTQPGLAVAVLPQARLRLPALLAGFARRAG